MSRQVSRQAFDCVFSDLVIWVFRQKWCSYSSNTVRGIYLIGTMVDNHVLATHV